MWHLRLPGREAILASILVIWGQESEPELRGILQWYPQDPQCVFEMRPH